MQTIQKHMGLDNTYIFNFKKQKKWTIISPLFRFDGLKKIIKINFEI